MNIFKILSSGDGTLKEPNISSFLKFLLDPAAKHNLKLEILKRFISILDKKFANELDNSFNVNSFLEENLTKEVSKENKIKKNISDIYIEISKEEILVYLIYIEVKIKASLSKNNQIYNQIHDIGQFKTIDKIPKRYIFLTPDGIKYEEYYKIGKNLIVNNLESIPLSWKNDIIPIINYELADNELKYLISSFIEFINSNFLSEYIESKPGIKNRVSYEEGLKTIRRYNYYMRSNFLLIVNFLKEIGLNKEPSVTKRKQDIVKFTYRKQEGNRYALRLDLDRSKIHCILKVPINLKKELTDDFWEQEKNNSHKNFTFLKDLYTHFSEEEWRILFNDIKNIVTRS